MHISDKYNDRPKEALYFGHNMPCRLVNASRSAAAVERCSPEALRAIQAQLFDAHSQSLKDMSDGLSIWWRE